MVKVKNHVCSKCNMEVEVPDFDETKPMSEYWPKWERAVLKHAWQQHRKDFPPQLKSFSQFMTWLKTPEGKGWNRKQGHWRNKILNGFVTLYCRKNDEHAIS